MSNFSTSDVKSLREATGAAIMDCQKALGASDGDMAKAKEWIKQKGLERAAKKEERETKEGYIAAYVHANHKMAAMVEILCETDFVALNSEFQDMAKDIAMHIVASAPKDVAELLSQEFIKDPSLKVDDLIKGLSGKIGEKFVVKRFVRYALNDE